jgi:hypothetical protein
MSVRNRIVPAALFAGILVSNPVLAQDRFAVWENNEEVVYVGPGDPRACSAFAAAPGPTVPSAPTARSFSIFECAPR